MSPSSISSAEELPKLRRVKLPNSSNSSAEDLSQRKRVKLQNSGNSSIEASVLELQKIEYKNSKSYFEYDFRGVFKKSSFT